jgi:DNA-binding MarR family transcriptional regulator
MQPNLNGEMVVYATIFFYNYFSFHSFLMGGGQIFKGGENQKLFNLEQDPSVISKISCLFRTMNSMMKKELQKYDIGRGQFHFLMYLLKNGDGISQEELNENLNFDKATTARAIKKLIKNGYLTKKIDDNDHRMNRIFLTNKAYNIYNEMVNMNNYWEKIITENLSCEEKEMVQHILNKMLDNILKYKAKDHQEVS